MGGKLRSRAQPVVAPRFGSASVLNTENIMDQRNWNSAPDGSAPVSHTSSGDLGGVLVFVGFLLALIATFYLAALKWLEAFGWS